MNIWGSIPEGKVPCCEAKHSSPFRAEAKNVWNYASTEYMLSSLKQGQHHLY
jgi:hypothetical protein